MKRIVRVILSFVLILGGISNCAYGSNLIPLDDGKVYQVEFGKEYTGNVTTGGVYYAFYVPDNTTITFDIESTNAKELWAYLYKVSKYNIDPDNVETWTSDISDDYYKPINNHDDFIKTSDTITFTSGYYLLSFGITQIDEVYEEHLMNDLGMTEEEAWSHCSGSYKVKISTEQTESLELEKNYISLKVGTSKRLTYTVFPENSLHDKVTFESSNPKVATVSSTGLIKTKSFGKTVITVDAGDGLVEKCTISVKEADVYLFEKDSKRLPAIYGKYYASWKSGNLERATANSYVKAKKQGKVVLTRKVNGITYKCNVYITNPYKLKTVADKLNRKGKTTERGYCNGYPVVVRTYIKETIFGGKYETYEVYRFNKSFKAVYVPYDCDKETEYPPVTKIKFI